MYCLSFILVYYSVKHAGNKHLQTKAAWKRSVFVCVKVINSAVDLSHGDNIFKDAKPCLNANLWGLQQLKLFITLYVYL